MDLIAQDEPEELDLRDVAEHFRTGEELDRFEQLVIAELIYRLATLFCPSSNVVSRRPTIPAPSETERAARTSRIPPWRLSP